MTDLNFQHSDQDGSSNSTGTWNSNNGSHNVGTVQNNIDPAFSQFGVDALAAARSLGTANPTAAAGALSTSLLPSYAAYTPAQIGTGTNALLYNAGLGPGAGYSPLTGTGTAVTPGQIASTDLSKYMDPYIQSVVDTTNSDIDRTRQQQIQSVGGSAETAGAYGGARHALLEGATNDAATRAAAASSAQLRSQGYTNAQSAAASDIGTRLNADEFNQNQDYQRRAADQGAALTAAGIRSNAGSALLGAANSSTNNLLNLNNITDPLSRLGTLAGIAGTLPKNTSTAADTSSISSGYGFGDNRGTSSQSGTSVGGGVSL
jgi:hypothetical protein